MAGAPQLREVGWFITGTDRDPRYHLFVRLEERMDGSGEWTVELRRCDGRGEGAYARHVYPTEVEAGHALQAIYSLSRHLEPLPTYSEQMEVGRWRRRTYQPTAYEVGPAAAPTGR